MCVSLIGMGVQQPYSCFNTHSFIQVSTYGPAIRWHVMLYLHSQSHRYIPHVIFCRESNGPLLILYLCTVLDTLTGGHFVFGQSFTSCSSFISLCNPMKFCTI